MKHSGFDLSTQVDFNIVSDENLSLKKGTYLL